MPSVNGHDSLTGVACHRSRLHFRILSVRARCSSFPDAEREPVHGRGPKAATTRNDLAAAAAAVLRGRPPARLPASNLFVQPCDSLWVMLLHPCDGHPVLVLQNPPVVDGIVVLVFKLPDFVPQLHDVRFTRGVNSHPGVACFGAAGAVAGFAVGELANCSRLAHSCSARLASGDLFHALIKRRVTDRPQSGSERAPRSVRQES